MLASPPLGMAAISSQLTHVQGWSLGGIALTEIGPEDGFGDRKFTFCIGGTQKSGTSTLSAMLDKHRMIQRAPRKEMHYFDDEGRDWTSGDHSDFVVPAKRPREQLMGDATPLYLWWPQALERIRDYNPDMKMIAIFRDPIERLFSQWVMNVNRWPDVAPDWPEFLTRFAPNGLEDQIPEGAHVGAYRMNSGVVRGYYGAQLERGFSVLGADQFHVLEFRSFLKNYRTDLDRITEFLGIHAFRKYPDLPHSMPGKPTVVGTAPTGADISGLVDRYRQDFATFKKLSGLDVSAWPLQRLLDGDLAADELAAQYATKVVATPAHDSSGQRRAASLAGVGPEVSSSVKPGRWSTGTMIGRCWRGSHDWVT